MNAQNLVIRPAIDSDIEKLVKLLSDDVTGHFPNDPSHNVPATFRCPAARIFVAEYGNEIAGTLTASWNGRNGELRYLWIAPPLRRKRLIQQVFDGLFDEAMKYLRTTGMQRVLLFVRRGPDCQKQIRMYKRRLDAQIVDPVVMALTLKDEESLKSK